MQDLTPVPQLRQDPDMRVPYDGAVDAAYISVKNIGAGESRRQIVTVCTDDARSITGQVIDSEGRFRPWAS